MHLLVEVESFPSGRQISLYLCNKPAIRVKLESFPGGRLINLFLLYISFPIKFKLMYRRIRRNARIHFHKTRLFMHVLVEVESFPRGRQISLYLCDKAAIHVPIRRTIRTHFHKTHALDIKWNLKAFLVGGG